MLEVLRHRTYRQLFLAQVVALVGTGLATVALSLLAFRLAGEDAGAVLGTALAIKMLAYVLIAPLAGAYADRVPRRALLIGLDVARVAIVVLLPFVDRIWQIYLLIFLLQSASAAFTPVFQATIPDVLPNERDYTRALSLARLAYDLESLLSPMLAAALLVVVTDQGLFFGTALGFVGSALLVASVTLPRALTPERSMGVHDRLTRGLHIYLATPRLRGLLALNLSAAAAGAMVIVNTVAIVRGELGRDDTAVALTFAAFGAGSMGVAFGLPRLLERHSDRVLMSRAGIATALTLMLLALVWLELSDVLRWPALLLCWLMLGGGYAVLTTPCGRLLRRSAHEADRPALFAVQFSLAHACWLVTYPSAGWVAATWGTSAALWLMSGLGLAGAIIAVRLWPREDDVLLAHSHDDLPSSHPHLVEHGGAAGMHRHAYLIDELHRRWPA
jgi:MFS family permease